jgi:hypothetical protein
MLQVPAHVIIQEVKSAADKSGFSIEQQFVEVETLGAATTWKIKRRVNVRGGGSLESCHEFIKALQARHASAGFNAEGNYWWAHDMPPGAAAPRYIYRWVLV